ncbi:MAG: hypothetical protein E7C82_07515 [Anaerococcus hydrogenalis]|uniref:hypothetical protein n=1 Tax=Anaerococcus hydrogenalis TaxID=33029 RepID=UPI0029018F2F|nr:hypothetical protein [Anaerococcus hydrogenalis]MDU2583527.1 hypothetical protein [Anaerococcus hydrogenalis]
MLEQIILVFVGALISIITTVIIRLVDAWLDNRGDVNLYRKIVYIKNSNVPSIGILNDNNDQILRIPMWVEIQNTKKTPIIIRDFSLVLYKDNKPVKKMKQVNFQTDSIDGKQVKSYYGDEGRYSFLLKPESIMRYDLLFALRRSECDLDFDEIKIVYYDSKNEKVTSDLLNNLNSWDDRSINVDEDWVKIN